MREIAFKLLVSWLTCCSGPAGTPAAETTSGAPVQEQSDPLRTFLSSAAISPDGALVLTGHALDRGRRRYGKGPASGSAGTSLPGLLCVWDVRTGGLRRAFDAHSLSVYKTRFLAGGKHILTGGSDGPGATDVQAWRVWDLSSGARVHDIQMEFGMFREDVSRDGTLLVDQGPRAGTLNVLDLRAGKLLRAIDGHADLSLGAVFEPDGKRLLFFGYKQDIKKSVPYLVDVSDGRVLGKFPADLILAAFSSDGKRLAGTQARSDQGQHRVEIRDHHRRRAIRQAVHRFREMANQA